MTTVLSCWWLPLVWVALVLPLTPYWLWRFPLLQSSELQFWLKIRVSLHIPTSIHRLLLVPPLHSHSLLSASLFPVTVLLNLELQSLFNLLIIFYLKVSVLDEKENTVADYTEIFSSILGFGLGSNNFFFKIVLHLKAKK